MDNDLISTAKSFLYLAIVKRIKDCDVDSSSLVNDYDAQAVFHEPMEDIEIRTNAGILTIKIEHRLEV